MEFSCPGTANIKTPELKIKKCPECSAEIEIFSNEPSTRCLNCGFIIYNDTISCIQWCRHAKDCIGEEEYNKLKKTI